MNIRRLKTFLPLLLFVAAFSGCHTENSDRLDARTSNNLSLGVSANDLLSSENFTSLQVEIISVSDYEPSPAAIEELQSFLEEHIHKPDGINISTQSIVSPGGGPYEVSDIVEVEKDNRAFFNTGKELAVFVFFADGKSATQEENKYVLGTAYKNTSLAIFQRTILDLSKTSRIDRSRIEATTLKHEFGHLFGLVGNGSPAQSEHEDSENNSHCNQGNCLMVASVSFASGAVSMLKSVETVGFGESCLEDLRANGGK